MASDTADTSALRRTVAIVTIAAAVAIAVAFAGSTGIAGATDAAQQPAEPALVVDLEQDGDATVTLVATYDLDDEAERDGFDQLRTDADARESAAQRFADRLAPVADEAGEAAGREMSVAADGTDVERDGDTGIVRIRATWTNLAGQDGDGLTLVEPFASGYSGDRSLTVVAPEGYALADAAPDPDTVDGQTTTWTSQTSFDGFAATYEPADADELPGFGILAAVAAALAGLCIAARR